MNFTVLAQYGNHGLTQSGESKLRGSVEVNVRAVMVLVQVLFGGMAGLFNFPWTLWYSPLPCPSRPVRFCV